MRLQGHGTKSKWRHSADGHEAGGSKPWPPNKHLARKGHQSRKGAKAMAAMELRDRRTLISKAMRVIAARHETWTGTPEEFREWALSVARVVYEGGDMNFDLSELDMPG